MAQMVMDDFNSERDVNDLIAITIFDRNNDRKSVKLIFKDDWDLIGLMRELTKIVEHKIEYHRNTIINMEQAIGKE